MRSTPNFASRLFLALAFAYASSLTSIASQASRTNSRSSSPDWTNTSASMFSRNSNRGGRLIVQRSPNFGTRLVLHLWIDGRDVADIQRDRRYDRFVSTGHHVLTVLAVPNSEFRQPTSTDLTVQPGHAYVFTAAWESDHVVLQRSTLLSGRYAVTPFHTTVSGPSKIVRLMTSVRAT
jgi:hypothetical protein